MPSESPYDRLGTSSATTRAPRSVPIEQGDTPFALAHRATGEWRDWRGVLDETDALPFDVVDFDHTLSSRLRWAFSTEQGGEGVEDLTTDTGVAYRFEYLTPELEGVGHLIIEDTNIGAYTIAFQAPGDEVPGDARALTDADWTDEATGEDKDVRVYLKSQSGRYAIDLGISRDLWLMLWLERCPEIRFAPVPQRTDAQAPGVDLG